MKNLMKIFLVMVIGLTVALSYTQVFADDVDDFGRQFEDAIDLTEDENNTTDTKNEGTDENVNNNITNTNTNTNTNANTNKNSSYNNTNLPKTGVEDALPIAVLVVVFGISAVYAYKKINYYKNI